MRSRSACHRTITLAAYVGMVSVAAGAVAYVVLGLAGRLVVIGGAIAVFVVYVCVVGNLERRAAQLVTVRPREP